MGSSMCHHESSYEPYGPKCAAADIVCSRAPRCAKCEVPCGNELRSREEDILADWTKLDFGASSSRPKPLRMTPILSPAGLITRHHGTFGGIGASFSYQEPPDPQEVYELKRRPIGFGSSAEVLLARHKGTRVLRAMKQKSKVPRKRLLVEDEEETKNPIVHMSRKEEVREVEVLMRLDHPNVVKLFEVFEVDDKVCLVMELLQGGSLMERVVPRSPRSERGKLHEGRSLALPEAEAAQLFWQMLSAVIHLHGNRVIHRDIKMDHFIFSNADETAQLKLVDFGFSWPLKPFTRATHGIETEGVVLMVVEELTIPGGAGTHRYLAPESHDSHVAAHLADRADVWALGVCLHAMLTGRLVPETGTVTQAASLEAPLTAMTEGHGLSAQASDLLQQLLRLKPEKRPNSAAVARHPWLAMAAGEDLNEAATLMTSRFISNLDVAVDATPLRRLFLLAVAREMEDGECFPFQCLYRALEAQCRGPPTERAMVVAIQRLAQDAHQQLLAQTLKAMFCAFGALDADASGSITWTEFLAAILLTQADVLQQLRKKQLQETAFERAAFRAFDHLSTGEPKISPSTLQGRLRSKKAQRAMDPEEMFSELGPGWTQGLSFHDFLCLLDGALPPPQPHPPQISREPLPPLPAPKDSRDEEPKLGGTEQFVWDEP